MQTFGTYRNNGSMYNVFLNHTKNDIEVILVNGGEIESAYKKNISGVYSFKNSKARDLGRVVLASVKKCRPKNGEPVMCELGSGLMFEIESKRDQAKYVIETFNNEVMGYEGEWLGANEDMPDQLKLQYKYEAGIAGWFNRNLAYIKLTDLSGKAKAGKAGEDEFDSLESVIVRSVEEIALEKEDITWLNKKKYYIVNDDAEAEQIFQVLDRWNGVISYDTETTGLKINCFGKINSKYARDMERWKRENPDVEPLRVDKLVGIIFCVEDDISYYFPCFNRKFKNLYSTDSEIKRAVVNRIKVRYTVGDLGMEKGDMARFIRDTPYENLPSDVILMERVRDILEKGHILAHNGAFEYKVGMMYDIDTNLKDDTMIMHQIMYKFRSTTRNSGESSALKYLSKLELGIDQWELTDFFPDLDTSDGVGPRTKKTKKSGSRIDFSYMDYAGTRIYAPTDGDATFLLYKKYKADMLKNHKEQEYIYNVEVIVACCIGYMEFYGIRIDEDKIKATRDTLGAEIALIESEVRQVIGFSADKEIECYNELKAVVGDKGRRAELIEKTQGLYSAIAENQEKQLNLASPSQVAELMFDVLKYPFSGDKKSVAKNVLKPLLKLKNEDGTDKYPVAVMYSEYKKKSTLMVKFFDNLTYFMYPGGLIFPSFGQISTATGRMSCSKPNAQQFPKNITKIIVPRPGYVMMDADYSQIEYRVLTALAGNDDLAVLFSDPDSDYHTLMASKMYDVAYGAVTPKMRGDAKSFNFGIPYGMGDKSLAILLTGNSDKKSVDEAKVKKELYFKNQPKTKSFFEHVKEMASVRHYTKTHWNRYRYYSFTDKDGNENNARRAAALRQAGNAVIQGCVEGNRRIQTKEFGIMRIKDLVGKSLKVWDGKKWSNGDITYSGKKRKCIVEFENGQQFICSPSHKFYVNLPDGQKEFIRCDQLISMEQGHPHEVIVNGIYCKSNFRDTRDEASVRVKPSAGISDDLFMDTERLRGHLYDLFFDKRNMIGTTIMTNDCGEAGRDDNLCHQIQKALLFFGVRSIYEESGKMCCIRIDKHDFPVFNRNVLGDKKEGRGNQRVTNCLKVKRVTITDEQIDMYDVCNTDGGYYVVDGLITHNTAADIFKISVARNFNYIRENKLFGKVIIINMIHDEQLFEIDATNLNIQRVLADVGKNMQFKVDGFPPLFIGAGVGHAWGYAKGKEAEIHPMLLDQFTVEAEHIPLWKPGRKENPVQIDDFGEESISEAENELDYFAKRILEFRTTKVREYVTNKDNYYKDLHPAIASLLNLEFTYGHDKAKEGLNDNQFTLKCIDEFIKHNGLEESGITAKLFRAGEEMLNTEDEEDVEYEDGEEDEDDEIDDSTFVLLDESDKVYGATVQDLISQFGFFVSRNRRICGIDSTKMRYKKQEELVEYLYNHLCQREDDGAMEIVFLQHAGVLNRTGVYVRGIDGEQMERVGA